MNRNFCAKIIASVMVLSTTTAHAEPIYMFRMSGGMTKVSENPVEDITLNFSPSAYYIADSVSLSGLVKSGNSISLESGALPPGLSLQGSSIRGTPTTAGTYSGIHFKVTNSKGESKVFGPFSIQIVGSVHASFAPQQIRTNTPYSNALTASGGVAPYSFRVVSGSLPSGLTLSPGGTLSGTVNTPTEADLTIEVTDGNGRSSTGTLFVSIVDPLGITFDNRNLVYVGEPQSWRIVASGGYGDLSYKYVGSVPGMTMGADGTVTGDADAAWNVFVRCRSDR